MYEILKVTNKHSTNLGNITNLIIFRRNKPSGAQSATNVRTDLSSSLDLRKRASEIFVFKYETSCVCIHTYIHIIYLSISGLFVRAIQGGERMICRTESIQSRLPKSLVFRY